MRTLGDLELPEELIEMVFSNIKNPWTAFHLGCANTRLLLIGEKRIRQLMGTPHWRGDRIICVGDYCGKDDIPEGLDMGYGYKVFCDSVQDGDIDDIYNVGPYGWACTFRDSSSRFWKKYKLSKDLEWSWRYPIVSIGNRMSEPICKAGTSSVLWNLSKQVYFRRKSIPAELPKATERFSSNDVMGTILLLQICWSTSDDITLSYESDDIKVNRGKWAGDRFEVTGDDVLESRLMEEGSKWKDVSEEVIKLFVDVFEAED